VSGRPLTMTYRLQFGPDLDFAAAEAIVPHLDRLGVSHLYASPITTARPGSTHGYDVVDPTEISPALGGRAGLERLVGALHAHGMGMILDIVPNHMSTHWSNPVWMATLELGPRAAAAATFDIDWTDGRILLPWLEDDLDACLAAGSIGLAAEPERGRIVAVHHDHRLPFAPVVAGRLYAEAARRADDADLAAAARDWQAVEAADDAGRTAERRARLVAALARRPETLAALEDLLDRLVAERGPRLGALLAQQHWRLETWRERANAIGYRRFFEIDDLIGVRVEDAAVFDHVHRLPVDLVAAGLVDGLRVDHVDGLADPAAYLAALRRAIGAEASLHVEKILIGEEALRSWPVDGTTGYEALNWINGLCIDPAGYRRLAAFARTLDPALAAPDRVAAAKREAIDRAFRPDVRRVAHLAALAGDTASEAAMEPVVAALAAAFPVYRSYLGAAPGAAEADLALVREAVAAVTAEGPADLDATHLAEFVRLLLDRTNPRAAAVRARFQQLTGAVTAKGYEDTELYRDVALAAANEVGGEIAAPAVAPAELHRKLARRQRCWPRALTPLSTHDTKRSLDVRARLDVLSETAEAWVAAVERWRRLAAPLVRDLPDGAAPAPIDQWIILQALAGAWPISRERIGAYVVKALREAKRQSDWLAPNEAYERAAVDFATALVDGPEGEAFRRDFLAFLGPVIRAGRTNSLAQTVIQMTAPGVPDIFQGSEVVDLSLVDPDNRRPIDWPTLAALPADVAPADVRDDEAGLAKLQAIAAVGRLRRAQPRVFLDGDYLPLDVVTAAGSSDTAVAFARRHADGVAVTVAPVRGLAAGNGLFAEHALIVPDDLVGCYDRVAGQGAAALAPRTPLSALLSRGSPAAVFWRARPEPGTDRDGSR